MAGHLWSFFAYRIYSSSHKYQIIQPNSNSLTRDPKQKYCAFMLSQNVLFHCLNSSFLHSKAKKLKTPQPQQLNSYFLLCQVVICKLRPYTTENQFVDISNLKAENYTTKSILGGHLQAEILNTEHHFFDIFLLFNFILYSQ